MTRNTPSIPFSVWRKMAMASWRPRKDPTISATMNIEASEMLRYIDDVKAATGQHVTPMHLVGRAAGKMLEALPGLNGRVVFGSFLPSPTIDCFFVVSLRTDPVTGIQAASTDLSGAVVRRVERKAAVAHRQGAGRSRVEDPPRRRPGVQADQSDGQGNSATAASPGARRHGLHHRKPAAAAAVHGTRGPPVRVDSRQQRRLPTVSTQPSLPCRPSSTCRSRS